MSKGNDHLFELIQTMSSSEKRYFKRHALIAKDSNVNYLKLFDTLNKMKEYDEDALKKKSFVKHLASERKYLYEAILRSLRNYNREESVRAQIYELLLDSDYLFQRGLYDQSERRLKKAHRLALQIEYLPALLEINADRRRLLRVIKPKTFSEEMEEYVADKDLLFNKMKNELVAMDLSDKFLAILIKNHVLKSEEEKIRLKEEFSPRLSMLSELDMSLEGERYLNLNYGFYYRLLGDLSTAEQFFAKISDWWDANPVLRRQKFYLFINGVANYLGVLIRLQKYDQVSRIIKEFDEINLNNFHERKAAFEKSANWKILYYFSKRDVEPIRSLIPKLEEGIVQYRISDYSTIVMEGNFILFYFLVEEWEECVRRIKKILASKRHQQREGVLRLLSILCLISYFELGHVDTVETTLRNTHRFFEKTLSKRERKEYEFELLAYFRRLINTPLLEQKAFFQDFDAFLLETVRLKEDENSLLGIEELKLWVASHLENCTIIEIFQRQKK